MKKFLSILLAALMILSNVSFAIPSAIGAMDTAAEMPVVEEPIADASEETAELSAVLPTTDAQLGELIVNVHLDSATDGNGITAGTWGQHSNGMTGSLASNNLQFNNNGTYKNDGSNGYAQFTLPLSTGQTFRYGGFLYSGEAGYTYTMAVDFRTTLTAGNLPTSGDTLQINDNSAGLNHAISTVADGEWHTYTYPLALDEAYTIENLYAMLYAHSNTSSGLAGTLDVDNIRFYKKPSTATVTFKADGKTLGTASLSTAGVTAKAIVDAASVPASKTVTGMSINGTSYTLSDTVILGGDCTVELVVIDNPNYDAELGIKVIESGFEAFAVGDAIAVGTTTLSGKDVTLADWSNFKGSGYYFELGGGAGAGSVAGDASNKYLTLPSLPSGSWFRFRPNIWSDANGIAGSGIVTVSFDARVNGTWNSSGYNHYAPHYGSAENSSNRVNVTLNTDGEWHSYTSAGFGDNGTTPVSTIMLRLSMTSGSVDIDNFAYWVKEPTTTITFTSNGKIVDTKENVETTGLLVSDLVSDVSVNPSKLITGISYGGKTFGLDKTVYFGGDNEVELVLVDNPNYDAEKGVLIAYSTFDALTSGTTYGNYVNVFSTFTGSYKGPDFASTNLYLQSDAADGHEFVDGAVKYQLKPNSNGARGFIFYGNTSAQYDAVAPAGVVTFEMDMKLEGASAAATSTTDHNMMRVIAQKDIVAKDHKPFFLPNDNTWHTYSFVTAGDHIGGIQLYQNLPSTTTPYVYLDNFKIYWKEATAPVYVYDGETLVNTKTISTTATHTVQSLLGDYVNTDATKVLNGAEIGGKFYGLEETVTLAGYNNINLAFTNLNDRAKEYGTPIFSMNFDNASRTFHKAGWIADEGNYSAFGGTADTSWYTNTGNVNLTLEGDVVYESGRGKVLSGSLPLRAYNKETGAQTSTDQILGFAPHANQSVTSKAGVYTFVYDAKLNVTSTYNADIYATDFTGKKRIVAENFHLKNDNQWHTYALSIPVAEDFTGDLRFIQYQTGLGTQTTTGTMSIDNIEVYYKPLVQKLYIYDNKETVCLAVRTLTSEQKEGYLVSDIIEAIRLGSAYNATGIRIGETLYGPNDYIRPTSEEDAVAILEVARDGDIYHNIHGIKIVDIDFDDVNPGDEKPIYPEGAFGAHQQVHSSDIVDRHVVKNTLYIESNSDNTIMTDEDGSKYLRITKPDQDDNAFTLRNAYHAERGLPFAIDGALTLQFDMRIPKNPNEHTKFDRFSVIEYDAEQDKEDFEGSTRPGHVTTTIADEVDFVPDGEWHTYTFAVNSDEKLVEAFIIYTKSQTVDVKNIKVYRKDTEGKVTFTTEGGRIYTYADHNNYDNSTLGLAAGHDYLAKNKFGIEDKTVYMSTTGITLQDIIPLVDYDKTNYKLVGVMEKTAAFDANAVIYDETHTIYLGKDTTFSLIFKEINLDWGYVFASATFDHLVDDKTTLGEYENVFNAFDGNIRTTRFNNNADLYLQTPTDSREWVNVNNISDGRNNGRVLINPAETKYDAQGNIMGNIMFEVYSDVDGTDSNKYEPMTVSLDGNQVAQGYYTIQFSYKYVGDKIDSTKGYNEIRFLSDQNDEYRYVNEAFILDNTVGDFKTVTFRVESKDFIKTGETGNERGCALSGFRIYQNITDPDAVLYIDDIRLSFRPYGVNLTIVDGDEVKQEVEYTAKTGGVLVSDIINNSGITPANPYKKITGVKFNDTEYALTNTINFAMPITIETLTEDYVPTPPATSQEIFFSPFGPNCSTKHDNTKNEFNIAEDVSETIFNSDYINGDGLRATGFGYCTGGGHIIENDPFSFSSYTNNAFSTMFRNTDKYTSVTFQFDSSMEDTYSISILNQQNLAMKSGIEMELIASTGSYSNAFYTYSATISDYLSSICSLKVNTLENYASNIMKNVRIIINNQTVSTDTTVNFKYVYDDAVFVNKYARIGTDSYTFDGNTATPATLASQLIQPGNKWDVKGFIYADTFYEKTSTEAISFVQTGEEQTVYVVVAPVLTVSDTALKDKQIYIDGKACSDTSIVVNENLLVEIKEGTDSRYYYVDNRVGNPLELTRLNNFIGIEDGKSLRLPDEHTDNKFGVRFKTTINPNTKSSTYLNEPHKDTHDVDASISEYGVMISPLPRNKTQETAPVLTLDSPKTERKYTIGTFFSISKGLDLVVESVDDETDILGTIFYNLPESEYQRVIETKMYVKLKINHEEYVVYGDSDYFTAYDVANGVLTTDAGEDFKDLAQSIIDAVNA